MSTQLSVRTKGTHQAIPRLQVQKWPSSTHPRNERHTCKQSNWRNPGSCAVTCSLFSEPGTSPYLYHTGCGAKILFNWRKHLVSESEVPAQVQMWVKCLLPGPWSSTLPWWSVAGSLDSSVACGQRANSLLLSRHLAPSAKVCTGCI